MPRLRFSDRYRNALVTGAGGGLGRAFVEMLLAEGTEVWGTSRHPENLSAAQRFHPVAFDLAGGNAADLVATVERESGQLDLLVHNAGYGIFGLFDQVPAAIWRGQINDLLGAAFALNQAALAVMRPRNRGGIVNVSSIAAELPIPLMSGYNAAKAGLSALSESLMLEGHGSGITFIDFRPGDYRTGFNQAMSAAFSAPPDGPTAEVWAALEATMAASPAPARAARDLRHALRRSRSGVVRSGSFFQAVIAPLGVRFLPSAWRRAAIARYFRLR